MKFYYTSTRIFIRKSLRQGKKNPPIQKKIKDRRNNLVPLIFMALCEPPVHDGSPKILKTLTTNFTNRTNASKKNSRLGNTKKQQDKAAGAG